MKIRRNIRVFFARYGKFLFVRIGIILLVIITIQYLNQLVIKNRKEQSENQLQEEIQNYTIKSNVEYIIRFLNYCNDLKIQEAYSMLSEQTKQEEYSTIQKFKENYIEEFFKIKQEWTITRESNNNFSVILVDNMLESGGKGNKEKNINFSILEENKEKKIIIENKEK